MTWFMHLDCIMTKFKAVSVWKTFDIYLRRVFTLGLEVYFWGGDPVWRQSKWQLSQLFKRCIKIQPRQKPLENVLSWSFFRDKMQFSPTLFRIFSSKTNAENVFKLMMLQGKGRPYMMSESIMFSVESPLLFVLTGVQRRTGKGFLVVRIR